VFLSVRQLCARARDRAAPDAGRRVAAGPLGHEFRVRTPLAVLYVRHSMVMKVADWLHHDLMTSFICD